MSGGPNAFVEIAEFLFKFIVKTRESHLVVFMWTVHFTRYADCFFLWWHVSSISRETCCELLYSVYLYLYFYLYLFHSVVSLWRKTHHLTLHTSTTRFVSPWQSAFQTTALSADPFLQRLHYSHYQFTNRHSGQATSVAIARNYAMHTIRADINSSYRLTL